MENKRKRKRKFLNQILMLSLSACVASVIVMGIAQILLSAFCFSRQAEENLEFYLESTNRQFDDRMKNMENMIVSVHNSRKLQSFLSQEPQDQEQVERTFQDAANLFSEQNLVDSVYPFVGAIYLFDRQGNWVSSQAYPQTVGEKEMQTIVFREMNRNFVRSGQEYRYVTTPARSYLCTYVYDDHMRPNGSCIVAIETEAVNALFEGSGRYPEQKWMVVSGKGDVLFSGGEESGMAQLLLESSQDGSRSTQIRDKNYLMTMERTGFGLRSGLMVDRQNIYKTSASMLRPFAILFFWVMGITAIAVMVAAVRITRPIRQMSEDIRRFGSEEPEGRMREFGIVEFDEISSLYNELTGKIRSLIAKVYEKQLLASQAQVRYLQSQINPHFMFNILSMLSMRAGLNGDREVQKLLSAFSRLMQGKIFRRGEVEIELARELELVEFYLLLQSERFSGKISYQISCEEQVKPVKIPRLLIEPLVENAVAHGLEPKPGPGQVRVSVKRQQDQVEIRVEDDGVGFCTEIWDRPETLPADDRHTHIGIENTRQMLKNVYGDQASMEIQSTVGQGTRIRISLPYERRETACGK